MIIQESREVNNADGRLIQKKLGQPPLAFFEHGDYLLRGNGVTCLIERVTNSGLLADIESGRMVSKLEGCSEDADIVLLLIEGLIFPARDGTTLIQEGGYAFSYYDLKGSHFPEGADLKMSFRRTGFRFASVQNFLTSCQLRWVHGVEFTLSASETAERLMELNAYFTKGFDQHLLHLTRSRPFTMKREDNWSEYLLSGLPGVGIERAQVLLDVFKNPLAVFNADIKQLAGVSGIGRVTARKIYEAVRNIEALEGR